MATLSDIRTNNPIIDTPFPDYEGENPGRASQTVRITLTIAGRAIATRVVTSTYYYLFTDHLGSTILMASQNSAKNQLESVTGSHATYYRDYRGIPPAQTLTDRGFTGQKSNNQPSADLGLLYYNARYYAPGLARFISADTIVPDPSNPQQFNRYSYTLNNPVRFTDPSGHSCSNPSNAWPETESCKRAEQQIMNATLRLIQTSRRRTPSRWSAGYAIELEIGTSHATMISDQKAITHNHFEGRNNSQWQIASANGTNVIPPNPGLPITWQGFNDATQTLLMDVGLGLLAYLNGGKAEPITPIYKNDWSTLIGQEVALISYDGQNTSVVWDTITGIYQDNTGSYIAVLSTHIGQQGQSGGGVFLVSGGQVSHIGNIYGRVQDTDEKRYLSIPHTHTLVALNPLSVVSP